MVCGSDLGNEARGIDILGASWRNSLSVGFLAANG